MASRLSEDSLVSVYDVGHRSINLIESDAPLSFAVSTVDLDAILMNPKAAEIIQAMSPLEVYRALMSHDSENSLEVLAVITPEQFTGILDFDAWREDRLVSKQVFRWLRLYGELGTKELYDRFSQLEEEYQLAVLGPHICYYTLDEYEKMPQSMQDRLIALPGAESYYDIITEDKEVFHGIENLIDSVMAHNMEYAVSLLTHSAYMPPAEQEELVSRFRKARIEEEGYVSYDESLTAFFTLDLDKKIETWNAGLSGSQMESTDLEVQVNSMPFLDQVFSYGAQMVWSEEQTNQLRSNFIFLANNLCAASQIETDDEKSLEMILRQARSLSGLALEVLSKGDLKLAAKIIIEEHPKELFRSGLTLVSKIQTGVLQKLEGFGLTDTKAVSDFLKLGKFGAAVSYVEENWTEKLGLLRVEALKGLMNRYPSRPVINNRFDNSMPQRIIFTPVDSVESYRDMISEFDALFSTLSLMGEQLESDCLLISDKVDFDRVLTTAVYNAIVNGSFNAAQVSKENTAVFMEMSESDVEAAVNEFLNAMKLRLDSQESRNWSLASCSEKYVAADYQRSSKVIHSEFKSVLANLTRARTESVKTGVESISKLLSN